MADVWLSYRCDTYLMGAQWRRETWLRVRGAWPALERKSMLEALGAFGSVASIVGLIGQAVGDLNGGKKPGSTTEAANRIPKLILPVERSQHHPSTLRGIPKSVDAGREQQGCDHRRARCCSGEGGGRQNHAGASLRGTLRKPIRGRRVDRGTVPRRVCICAASTGSAFRPLACRRWSGSRRTTRLAVVQGDDSRN